MQNLRARVLTPPLHIGCSGWQYRDWRGPIYPPGCPQRKWLAEYARRFDTVEVNSTFYRLARPEAVGRWLEQTPPGFLFTIKSSRYLTHVRRLADMERGVERLYAGIAPLVESPKMGPVLWQLPANFHRDDDRLGSALERLTRGRHCFEFRHPSCSAPRSSACSTLSERELREWAARIAALRSEAGVPAYFNNDWEGFAVRNGRRLAKLLEG